MNRDELDELAGDPRHIPGIYNYCDRWCERCAFTERCLQFAIEQIESPSAEERDLSNKAFWEALGQTFASTIQLLEEYAEEQGIDLNAVDIQDEMVARDLAKAAAEENTISVAARAYGKSTGEWIDSAGGVLDEKSEALSLQHRSGLPGADPKGEAAEIQDSLEVIRWYQHFIYVKLIRALQSGSRDFDEDTNGSAKVALTAIDRSISAWASLLDNFPEQEDEILGLLVSLERLRRGVELEFPSARAYVRPGLDEDETS